jgi:hypothetical protein
MGVAALSGLDHLVDDVLWRRLIGIAHAEIDNVFATFAGGCFQFPSDVEDIGGQSLDARKFSHGGVRQIVAA